MSSKSTFSYAQAARGLSGTPAPSKAASTDTEKSEAKSEEQSNPALTESVTTVSESEGPRDSEKVSADSTADAEFTTVTSKHAARSKATSSRNSSPSVGPRSANEKSKDDSSNVMNGTTEPSSEKQSNNDAKADKSETTSEVSKEKSAKSDKPEKAEKSDKSDKPEKKKEEPPKELKAAPLPSVNIWQQRKEAQEAKAKTAPTPTPAPTGQTGTKTDESSQSTSKTSSKKKGADGTPDGKDRKKNEGGKVRDDALPAVGDAAIWPTPEVAVGEEKKKAQEKTADKAERSDKSPVLRPHGKEKWMPVNYVPTAVFNTPLPSSGRGGRRATRGGGREGGRGGAQGAGPGGEKGPSTQPAQGSVKQAAGERGRNEAGTGRAASLPAQSRRSTSTDVAGAERKAQPLDRGRGGPRTDDANAPTGKQVNGGEHSARPPRESKPFTKAQHGQVGDRNSRNAHLAVDAQAAARANDRRVESGSKSADLHRDPSGYQDFNRERGGRSNRGRGPYATFGGQNPQFGTMPHNTFVPPKSYGFNDRQRSHPGLPNGNQQGNRMQMRSPSLPASAGMYPVYPFPNDINTMYPYQNVPAAPMSAMPFQQYMEPFSLMSMLTMQLEYYFSVDNMCKDMFLRKHMDSQGFVPLGVIASFKRVKSLTEDFELLRHVARQLRNVEYQTGEDGIDRLRPRENWAQWVLPVDHRETSAQHEGAPPANYLGKTNENVPFQNNYVDTPPNGLMHGPREFIPNGTALHDSRTPLSSTAPEFMPSMLPTSQNEIVNVGDPTISYVSPTGSPTTAMVNPFDELQVDKNNSARGLKSNRPSPRSHSRADWAAECSPGPEAERKHSQSGWRRSTYHSDEPSTRYNPPFEGRDMDPTYHEKSFSVRNQPTEMFQQQQHAFWAHDPQSTFKPHRMAARDPPYHAWSHTLSDNFDYSTYNKFRRSAIDELITRHNDNGFNYLMDFYRFMLRKRQKLPDGVISDLASLSRTSEFDFHVQIHQLLTSMIESGSMERYNRKRVCESLGIDEKDTGAAKK